MLGMNMLIRLKTFFEKSAIQLDKDALPGRSTPLTCQELHALINDSFVAA